MPPKKDDKKKGKDVGGPVALREIDLAHYIRKPTPIAEPNPAQQKTYQPYKGKMTNIDQTLPFWPETLQENWGEAIAEGGPEINYPSYLQFDKYMPAVTYFGLDAGEPVDPKAKGKKEVKKPPAKGKEEVVAEVIETLVNENGVTMPVIYQAQSDEWTSYPPLSMNNDESGGADTLMSDVFTMIARFSPSLSTLVTPAAQNEAPISLNQLHNNYLWRSVYPQLSSNSKPVYNATGRHVVKLFVAGAWRKVTVSDTIPVQADGRPCLATTSTKLELWPVLLSKALYTAYTALKYTFLDSPDTIVPLHEKKSLLFTFAMQCFTGWNPHQQRLQWPQSLVQQPSKSVDLLMLMLHSGIPLISENDVVAEDDCFKFNLPADATATSPSAETKSAEVGEEDNAEEETEGEYMKTKRRFKEEYQARKAQRDEIIRRVLERERRVNAVDAQVTNMTPSEVFYLLRNRNDDAAARVSISGILGIVLPQDKNPLEVADLTQVRLLLHWHRKPSVSITPNTTDPLILGKGKYAVAEFLQAFPQASPVDYEWCTLSDLIAASEPTTGSSTVHLASFFTGKAFRHQVEWSRRWLPYVPPNAAVTETNAKDSKGKAAAAKDKKKGEVVDNSAANDALFAEPAIAPPTFLKIDLSALKAAQKQKQSSTDDQHLSAEEQEIAEALAMQQQALPSSTQTATTSSTSSSSSALQVELTVTLSADIVELVSSPTALPPSEGEAVPTESLVAAVTDDANPNNDTQLDSADGSKSSGNLDGKAKLLPSETLLILQEVYLSPQHSFAAPPKRMPRIFVMKLSEFASLPMATQLIRLSLTQEDDTEDVQEVYFWIRLFTRSSISVRFDSNAAVSVDLAENLWQQATGGGYEVLVEQGECVGTVVGVDQPLLRFPMLSKNTESATSSSTADWETAMVFFHVSHPSVATHVDLSYTSLVADSVSKTGHGHVMDVQQFPAIQGVLAPYAVLSPSDSSSLPEESPESTTSNAASANFFPPSPVLLATLRNTPEYFHQHMFLKPPLSASNSAEALATTTTSSLTELPPFQWKLVVLSRRKLATVTEVFLNHPSQRTKMQENPVTQRYEGVYVPNQAFRLFKDSYTFDRNTFPLSVKLSLAKLPDTDNNATTPSIAGEDEEKHIEEFDDETPPFALRLYRKHDDVLLAEHSAQDILEIQWQDFGLLDDPAHPAPAPAATAATTTAPAAAKGKAAPAAKPAAGKGAAAPAEPVIASGPPIEITIECVLLLPPPESDPIGYDKVYRKYFSRYPHVFDAFFSLPGTTEAAVPAAAAGEEEGLSGSALHKETMALQRTFLHPTPIHEPSHSIAPVSHNNNNNNNSSSRPHTASYRTLPGHIYTPPATPSLHWRLDWQAGRVLAVSHDTTQLLKYQALKQSWETLPEIFTSTVDATGKSNNPASGATRYERAQAALQFLRLSTGGDTSSSETSNVGVTSTGNANGKSVPSSRPATAAVAATNNAASTSNNDGSSAVLSQASIEQLVTALAAPGGLEEIHKRYAAVFAAAPSSSSSSSSSGSGKNTSSSSVGNTDVVETQYLRHFESLIAPNRAAEDAAPMGSDAWQALVSQRRAADAEKREKHYQELLQCIEQRLTVQTYTQECNNRLQTVQQRLQEQRKAQALLWEEREKVRVEYEAKNQALYALLKRAKDAKTSAAAAEAAAEAERLKNEAKNSKGKKK